MPFAAPPSGILERGMPMALGVFLLGGLIMMQVVRIGIMGLVGGGIGYGEFAIFITFLVAFCFTAALFWVYAQNRRLFKRRAEKKEA